MRIDTEKLDVLIANKGLMLKDVASASGITENCFRNIRTGKAVPRLRTIGRIASALNVSVKDLIIKDGED
ncbi:helix-turn-helix domain-containing protein [Blautia hansenii]|uniref:Helix-turn-helix transcriptional regulator n=1 Tax=Blautia hansenii TaxID=1322 RepID=A0ABX2I4M2_BLAHA|nr:helix-turn-helix transcriptional regulator [Blautia hansenii]MCB5599873.1 helix-turn-helix transcriptional regulator [Blautia hansenii]NSJ85396.1 helix-turn-helix transcriptional regulator [Blautia hansenii]